MNVAVLCSPKSWYFRDLLRAAGEDYKLTAVPFSKLSSSVVNEGCVVSTDGQSLHRFDATLVRTMPPGSLEQVVFRMDALQQLQAAGMLVVNPARAIEAAVDKYLATAKLQRAGLTVPCTIACQTVDEAMTAFECLRCDVVVKPLFGSEGRGLVRITDDATAMRVFKALVHVGSVIYLQEFIAHEGFDIRLLVLGDEVIGMRRINPNDWRTNVSLGATVEAYDPTQAEREMALRASTAVDALIAGVDLLPGNDGKLYVIEVNAVPGWRALAKAHQVDIARMVLDKLPQFASNPAGNIE